MRLLLVACILLGACTAPEVARGAPTEPAFQLDLADPPTTFVAPEPTTSIPTTTTSMPPEPTTTTTEPPRPPVTAASRSRGAPNWEALRQCESGGGYSTNTGNGYYGAYQFDLQTWRGLGYEGLPSDAPPSTQDEAAQRLYAARGASPWPVCGRRL